MLQGGVPTVISTEWIGKSEEGGVHLSESSGLTLGLEKSEDVVNLDGALDVADDRSSGLVHEFDTDLDDTTARAGAAENLGNLLSLQCKYEGKEDCK